VSRYGHLLEGIKSGMQFFQTVNLIHVKCEANSTAHELTREAVTHINVDSIWMEEIPP
jgi:hypothetical protein